MKFLDQLSRAKLVFTITFIFQIFAIKVAQIFFRNLNTKNLFTPHKKLKFPKNRYCLLNNY